MKAKISFITTVFNEENNIDKLLDSLISQTILPDEIIIVDGGSNDSTISKIKKYNSISKTKKIKLHLFVKKGNRSIGRNEAIRHANSEIILCSDAGNILDKKWIENITKPFSDKDIEVVAGYYKGKPKNIFQKCLIPYVLTMPDKIKAFDFLPATRSMAFKKSIWSKIGGFPEEFSHNEDYVFANYIKKIKTRIFFAKDAIVYWLPRDNFKQSFIMFFRFAYGDAESKIIRPKVIILFIRYIFGVLIFMISIYCKSYLILIAILILFIFYILWSILKNFHYINDYRAIFLLPALQITSDIAILSGTFFGTIKILNNSNK